MSQSLILHHLYTYSSTLLETISRLAPWCTHLLQEDDPQSFHKLCRTTLIGSNAVDVLQSNASPTFIQGKRAELHELLPHIINLSLRLPSQPSSVLNMGYKRGFYSTGNTVAAVLQQETFQLLHKRIGDDLMTFLVLHCSMFLALDSFNYLQISGPPIINLLDSSSVALKLPKPPLRGDRKRKATVTLTLTDSGPPLAKRPRPDNPIPDPPALGTKGPGLPDDNPISASPALVPAVIADSGPPPLAKGPRLPDDNPISASPALVPAVIADSRPPPLAKGPRLPDDNPISASPALVPAVIADSGPPPLAKGPRLPDDNPISASPALVPAVIADSRPPPLAKGPRLPDDNPISASPAFVPAVVADSGPPPLAKGPGLPDDNPILDTPALVPAVIADSGPPPLAKRPRLPDDNPIPDTPAIEPVHLLPISHALELPDNMKRACRKASPTSKNQQRLRTWLLSMSKSRRQKAMKSLVRNAQGKGLCARKLCVLPMKRMRVQRRRRQKRRSRERTVSKATPPMTQNIRRMMELCFNRSTIFYSPATLEKFTKDFVLNTLTPTKTSAAALVRRIFEKHKVEREEQKKAYPARKANVASALSSNLGGNASFPVRTAEGPKRMRGPPQRINKRLQHALPVFLQLIENHKKCRYRYILEKYCPLPQGFNKQTDENDPNKEKMDYSSMVASFCSHEQVHKFLQSVVNNVVPDEIWGSSENKLIFFKYLRDYVGLRRWEKMTLRQMMVGIKLSHCTWMKVPVPQGRGRGYCCSPSSDLKETEMFGNWVTFLMDEIINMTLKAFFYVTLHSDHRNHVFYHRKPVWSHICSMALKDRTGVMLAPLPEDELTGMLMRNRTLGISKLRFLPKSNGVRPLVNLGSKVTPPIPLPGGRRVQSINYQLQNVFHILTFEKKRKPELVGSTCSGYNELYQRLKAYKLSQVAGDNRSVTGDYRGSPFLFVHLDISNCFDSMDVVKLFDILQQKIVTEETYLLRRYSTVRVSRGRIRRCFHKMATTRADCQPFFEFACDLSKNTFLKSSIITDLVTYPVERRSTILEQLKAHLFTNIVKVKGGYYKQIQGIPQGSTLSSLLCSFYYGELENKYLPHVEPPNVQPPNGLMMRYVDDFLLVTRDPRLAETFLTTMTRGIPEYNCYVNPNKTVTNFKIQEDNSLKVLEEVHWVDWCGQLINTKTLDVQYDYSRYTKKNIRDNLTIVTHTKPFHNLQRQTNQSVLLRCQPVFLDCEMLSERTVVTNIFQGFVLAAIKFYANIRALSLGAKLKKYSHVFFSIIKHSIHLFYDVARKRCTPRGRTQTTFTIPMSLCIWLGCQACYVVLKRKDPRRHRRLITCLGCNVKSISHQVSMWQLKRCLRATRMSNLKHLFSIKC